MLTKILINNEAYEVNLLTSLEVIENIKKLFLNVDSINQLKEEKKLNEVISQYIDYYEKVTYNNKEYFILKSRIPVEFKQKTHTKKFINNGEIFITAVCSLVFPIMFIATNIFDSITNIKNKIKSKFGITKINAYYNNREAMIMVLLLLGLNVGFYIVFAKSSLPYWSLGFIQAINYVLGVLKPIKYHYNNIENYKLCSYTFDTNYNNISIDPMEKLKNMKATVEKKKNEFNFSQEDIKDQKI